MMDPGAVTYRMPSWTVGMVSVAWPHAARPRQPKLADVLPVDLIQRAEAPNTLRTVCPCGASLLVYVSPRCIPRILPLATGGHDPGGVLLFLRVRAARHGDAANFV